MSVSCPKALLSLPIVSFRLHILMGCSSYLNRYFLCTHADAHTGTRAATNTCAHAHRRAHKRAYPRQRLAFSARRRVIIYVITDFGQILKCRTREKQKSRKSIGRIFLSHIRKVFFFYYVVFSFIHSHAVFLVGNPRKNY